MPNARVVERLPRVDTFVTMLERKIVDTFDILRDNES